MSSSGSSSGRFRVNEEDWVCADSQCGNVNFARRTSCNRCGKVCDDEMIAEKSECPKKKKLGTEIGKAAAEKSGGLFSADDWQCSNRCGNVNWARRQQCNMCNAPKFGEVEERTGYGGGYNERENVEYIEREDSDGEYDEFGRRKKGTVSTKKDVQRRDPAPSGTVARSGSGPVVNEEEEEEDDDDDDDGDLSKYDLSGFGDDSDEEKTPTVSAGGGGGRGGEVAVAVAVTEPRSRSRSVSPPSHHSSKSSTSSHHSRTAPLKSTSRSSPPASSSSRSKTRHVSPPSRRHPVGSSSGSKRSRSRSGSQDSKSIRRRHSRSSSRSRNSSRDRSRSRSASRNNYQRVSSRR